MMTDEARDEAEKVISRSVARATSACTPEGCHNRFCSRCNPIADAKHAELSDNVTKARAAMTLAYKQMESAYAALDDYEVSLGLPSILR